MFVLLKALPLDEDITNSSLIVPTTKSLAGAIQVISAPWSPSQGYPSVAVFYENRFWLAASRQFPQTMWISSTGDYFDMETKTDDDDGFDRVIAGAKGLNIDKSLAEKLSSANV
jgi:hypothetical protein